MCNDILNVPQQRDTRASWITDGYYVMDISFNYLNVVYEKFGMADAFKYYGEPLASSTVAMERKPARGMKQSSEHFVKRTCVENKKQYHSWQIHGHFAIISYHSGHCGYVLGMFCGNQFYFY